jgi:prepilin-type N-terminal cleavage/methylation domain-containing protein
MRSVPTRTKAGLTLVEVLIAVVLVGTCSVIIYNGGLYSYKSMMRSRARLEAQGVAFDKLWQLFNMSFEDLPSVSVSGVEATPERTIFSTNGIVQFAVMPETNAPLNWIEYWEIRVQVWPQPASPLFSVMDANGTVTAEYTEPLADYTLLRYRGER